MKFLIIFFSIGLFLTTTSCGGKKEKKIVLQEKNLEEQMVEAYQAGVTALEEGDVLFAAKNFNIVENIYPQSIWAPRSVLMAAYSYYIQDYYGDAIFELDRFIKKYPNSKNISYAYFLLATCYYELIIDETKDLSPLLKSKKNFIHIIENYPDTDFALDAKFKLLLIDNILASKEVYIARYYLQREKWIPALNRFKNVINNYGQTEYVEESLHRLVEIYFKLGLIDESKKYASLLGYNYQSSDWYKKTYKVFNRDYDNPIKKIKKDKGSKLLKKFKSLFD